MKGGNWCIRRKEASKQAEEGQPTMSTDGKGSFELLKSVFFLKVTRRNRGEMRCKIV